MNASDLITVDPDILGGTPVFKSTRVPVKTLFDYLEGNYTLEGFLECFPSVTREMAQRLLEQSESALLALPALLALAGNAPAQASRFFFGYRRPACA